MIKKDIDKKLHFIIGFGRSGTTLLTTLLNNHPEIHCLPEANFLAFFLNKYTNKKVFSNRDIDRLFEQIKLYSLSHPWIGWEFNIDETKQIVKTYCHQNNLANYIDICKIIYGNFKVIGVDKTSSKKFLDKNPSFTLFVDYINNAIPNAKYIWLIRDYRANVLSRKQSVYLESDNVSYNSYMWRWYNKKALQFQKQNNQKVLLIRYEDLVEKPENELKKICRFLEINDTYSLTFQNISYDIPDKNISLNQYTRFKKKYSDLNQSINTGRLNTWKEQLTLKEIKICDAINSKFSEQFNYPPFCHLTYLQKFVLKLTASLYFIKSKINCYKEHFLYRVNPIIKLNRLRVIYKKMDFK